MRELEQPLVSVSPKILRDRLGNVVEQFHDPGEKHSSVSVITVSAP